MNYSFLALQNSPPSMHPRGSIYSPPIGNGGSHPSVFQAYGRTRVKLFRTLRKSPKLFIFMHISRCMRVLSQNMHVHSGIGLKVMYTNKQVVFRDFLGSSKYSLSKGGVISRFVPRVYF